MSLHEYGERTEEKGLKWNRGCKGITRESKTCIRDFGDVTSLHGIRYVTNPHMHLVERLCWLIAITLSALVCGLEISKLWQRWQISPIITSFAQNPTKVTTIPFPAVTICPENKVRKEIFDLEANFSTLINHLNGSKTIEDFNEKTLAEAISLVCQRKSPIPSNFHPGPMHREQIRSMSLRVDDIFESCVFNFINYNCSELFYPIITKEGLCYNFNMIPGHDLFTSVVDLIEINSGFQNLYNSSWDPENGYIETADFTEFPRRESEYIGPASGLQVTLKSDVETAQHECTETNAENFRISIHSTMEFPSPVGNYLHVSPGAQILVPVRPRSITTEPELRHKSYSAEARGCNFPEEHKLKFLRMYTKQNCILDQMLTYILDSCGCTLFYMPLKGSDFANSSVIECTKYIDCNTSMLMNRAEKESNFDLNAANAKCLPSCFDLQYEFQASFAKLAKGRDAASLKTKFAKIIIFFQEESFYGMKKSELYGITDFVASCGGLLGLFTGFSVISLVEFCYFATLRHLCRGHRNHISSNTSA